MSAPRVAVLQSPDRADVRGASYRFAGAGGKVAWPMEEGRALGQAGAFNAFLRMGFLPQSVAAEALGKPEPGHILAAAFSGTLPEAAAKGIRQWIDAGGIVVASGTSASWSRFLPGIALEPLRPASPYGAFAYLLDGAPPELMLPPRWSIFRMRREPAGGSDLLGRVALVHGERQTPSRALVSPFADCPAIVRSGRFHLLNGDPFAALQAWAQGQEDLEPWLAWRHRLFWLDEWVAFLRTLLVTAGALPEKAVGAGVRGLAETTVVLRHDLDHSRDTAYLDLEHAAGIPAVHAILKDENTGFWRQRLEDLPAQESAFHYNTARSPRASNFIRRDLLGLAPAPYLPARKLVAAGGLLSQVRWAKRNGVGIATLHRHLSFIYYPELVDALDEVFSAEQEVLGGSSFFRGHLLRWGIDRVDGARGTHADFPDAQFPYWFPFRMAHAGRGGRMLRGWETTSVMEIEPGLVEQMLRHRVPGIPQRVMVLTFHPAHARSPTFTEEGSAAWFRETVDLLRATGARAMTLKAVFQTLDRALRT